MNSPATCEGLPVRLTLGLFLISGITPAVARTCTALLEYDEILSVVTTNFFDQTFNGLDWDAHIADFRTDVTCEADSRAVAAIVNSALSALDASHTALYTRADQHYWGLHSFYWGLEAYANNSTRDRYEINFSGIWADRIDDRWHATFVLEGSPAQRAGVLAGDELVALDESEFQPLAFRRRSAVLAVSSDGQTVRELQIQPVRQSLNRGFDNAALASAQVLRLDGKRAGFFHVWSGSEVIRRAMNEALAEFEIERVDALILDFRGGYGGVAEEHIAAIRGSAYLSRIPMFVLIDGSVRSGKELVAGVIKRDGLGTLVGETTAGAFLLGGRFPLFDGKYLLYLAVGNGPAPVIPGIGQIERNGIQPDVHVSPCRRYCAGRDPIFERTADLIFE